MAWGFEADPELEAELSWMREFIDTELIPLEPILRELPPDEWHVVRRHLQDQVKAQGLWGAFLDPKLGGSGLRSAEARADVGDHRALHVLDGDLRRAGARQRQHGAAGARGHRRAEGTLALAEPAR